MTRGDYIRKWTSYAVALVLVAALNFHVLTFLPLGAVPALLPEMAVAVGVLEGPVAGAGFGIAAGLMQAAATHGSAVWVFLLSLIGWACGLLALYVLRRDVVGFVPAAALTALILEGAQVLSRLMGHVAELPALLEVALPELLWTAAFSLPVYGVCRFCCKHYGRLYYE